MVFLWLVECLCEIFSQVLLVVFDGVVFNFQEFGILKQAFYFVFLVVVIVFEYLYRIVGDLFVDWCCEEFGSIGFDLIPMVGFDF